MRYRDVFPNRHTFLAVIHVESASQAIEQAAIAREGGADGIFLINHNQPYGFLRRVYISIRQIHPDWWIGLNFLDLTALQAITSLPDDASGLWTDNAGVPESASIEGFAAEQNWMTWQMECSLRPSCNRLYFGGVAFKYQGPVADPAGAAWNATKFMDVITTSGDQTGSPPAVGKIVAMRDAIGNSPLAIASGIAPENVPAYLSLADCFLVATGISRSFTEFDPARVRALAEAIRR
ncbi:MAG: BtpA/SgcQ family protein [bacterium]|nr:BtpA/SgcQ family protein [bacterium]